jgi:tetratricopeptide (TPR) repeat protein
MVRSLQLLVVLFCGAVLSAAAQQKTRPQPPLPASQAPPRSADSQTSTGSNPTNSTPAANSNGYSTSRTSVVDLSPPPDDAKTHPDSTQAVREAEDAAGLREGDEIGGVQDFHLWDPHKAAKDIEVGDFYFHQKNYRAALDRYEEALLYQYNNALASFKVGECQEVLGAPDEAREAYQAYLNILPEGPLARKAHDALIRLEDKSENKAETKTDRKKNAPDVTQAQPH